MAKEELETLIQRAAYRMKSPEQGAATTLWCAVSHQLDARGGVYCVYCNIAVPVPANSEETRGVRP